MYVSFECSRIGARSCAFPAAAFVVVMAGTVPALAQEPAHQHEAATPPQAGHEEHEASAMAREASGTAWLPDESPMYAIHRTRGAWTLMFHQNAFLQYLHESGERGDDQVGSINWIMGMAQRDVGAGRLGFRGMFSAEPWSIRGCGYPDLLATGEECLGEKIHDRQHPHDHRLLREDSIWATTVAWGRNAEAHHASNALLIETNITLRQRDAWYGRFEVVGKSAHDLDVAEPPGEFTVSKLQGGYTRYLPAWNGFRPGVGAGVPVGLVPESLQQAYGSGANVGFAVYLTLRPGATGPGAAAAPAVDHSQHGADE